MSITEKILEQLENSVAGLTTYETPAKDKVRVKKETDEEVLEEAVINNDFGSKNEVDLKGTSTGGTKTYQSSTYVNDFLSSVDPDVNLVIKEKDKPFDKRIKNIEDYDRRCCGSGVTSKVMASFNGLL